MTLRTLEPRPRLRCLLVSPAIPVTYWGLQESLPLVGKAACQPPLGLLTLAAQLPDRWELRLVDLNVDELDEADLEWADAVLVGGMFIQVPSMQELVARARARGCVTAVGGPAPTTCPELFDDAHVVFQGEAEGRIGELVQAVEASHSSGGRRGRRVLPAPPRRPDLSAVPVPRYDLLDPERYGSISIQYSRGCPFQCEFCDIIQIFGRRPRTKSAEQILAELDAIRATGYRGAVFFVDDNFIGNKRAVRGLLPALIDWQERHGRPFELITEASVNLAEDPELMTDLVRAGFYSVFLGIETPSTDSLAGAGKLQNLRLDLAFAVDTVTAHGLEVMGGFIVGFDADGPEVFEAQRAFIQSSPIPLAMVGVLNALPGTPLWHRLRREGRLREDSDGDQFGRPNFEVAMGDAVLLGGYADLMAEVYSADGYYRRCTTYLARVGARPAFGDRGVGDLVAFARAVWHVGVVSPRRRHFWKLLGKAVLRGKAAIKRAVTHAVMGEHLIRYTERHVLPAVRRSIAEIEAQAEAQARPPAPLLAAS